METKFYSFEEVSQNDGKNGRTWIIIKDVVYDVTDFIDEHPGGGDLIRECAGKNATKDFENAGHSSEAKKDLKKYKIGELRQEDRKQKQEKISSEKSDRTCISYITCGLLD